MSRHCSFTSGSILKMVANSAVATAHDSTRSTDAATSGAIGIHADAHLMRATMLMLMMSEVSSRNPMIRTTPSDSSRVVRNTARPLRDGRATTPQKSLSEVCICANIVVAPNRSVAMPMMVGKSPPSFMRELRTASSTAIAAWAPTKPLISAETWPRAASSPSTMPMMATMMMTSGAIENRV